MQLINPRLTKNFHGSLLNDTLKRLTVEINKDKDIRLPCNLQKINDKELNILKVGQDGNLFPFSRIFLYFAIFDIFSFLNALTIKAVKYKMTFHISLRSFRH